MAVELEAVVAAEGERSPPLRSASAYRRCHSGSAARPSWIAPARVIEIVLERRLERRLAALAARERLELGISRRGGDLEQPAPPEPCLVGPRRLAGEERHLVVRETELAARPARLQQRDRLQACRRDSST